MASFNTLYVPTRQEWHAWLESHFQDEKEIWLVYYKAATGQASIPYDDSVEEALCFGWIDSIIKRIDDRCYARKFTPRTNTTKWSEDNKRRVQKLVAEGRMTAAGLAKFPPGPAGLPDPDPPKKDLVMPPEVEAPLRANPQAWQAFNRLPPSHRRRYMGWVTSAKRPETIQKRLAEVITLLEQNKPLPLK